MARITGNRLLALSLLGFAAYWIIGGLTPKPYLASLASLMLLILSGMTLWRWGPTAWNIVVRHQRSSDDGAEGSHLAVYGTSLIALGLHYSAWYRLMWIYCGSPQSWTNSVYSSAGIATATVGLVLLYFSPDVSRTEMKTPNTIWLVTLVAAGLLFAFFLGTKAAPDETGWKIADLGDRAGCPDGRRVIGSRDRVYHTPSSRYRSMVAPARCFRTEAEAVAAGFRAPR